MEDVRQRFAATLRSARDGLGLSQEDLAERVELSVEALGRLERGRVLPRAETLLRIADATGLSVDALLGRVAPVPGEDPYFGELLARTTQAERRFLVAVLPEPASPPVRRAAR